MKLFMKILLLVLLCALIVGCTARPEQVTTPFVPTPGTDTGVVTGKMTGANAGTPVPGIIFLSKNLTEGRTDVPPLISFSYQSNPRGVVDENGFFYFVDVPEGTYAITIWSPPNQTEFVADESGQDYLWVTVEGGKTTELGEVKIP